ncbi:MAG: hypothetical protein DRR00_29035 [Candidatus Parabeggiatoa sp. nov. 3]|nr:MAG: hypothetical protein DRR00_29035 [Gammaproteobacteria bacterium]
MGFFEASSLFLKRYSINIFPVFIKKTAGHAQQGTRLESTRKGKQWGNHKGLPLRISHVITN